VYRIERRGLLNTTAGLYPHSLPVGLRPHQNSATPRDLRSHTHNLALKWTSQGRRMPLFDGSVPIAFV
jgi:hypothetical protein